MPKRKTIKKSMRFKIFERDNFTCQYCGKKPPCVILHIDHIHPVKEGGGDEELNLITSCQDCNLGKSDKILKNPVRANVKQELEDLKEVEDQVKEYYKYLKKIKKIKEEDPILKLLCETWDECSDNKYTLSKIGKTKLQGVLKKYVAEDIIEAMNITWSNDRVEVESKFTYMCGVLKNLKLNREDPKQAKINNENRLLFHRLLSYWKDQKHGSGFLPEDDVKVWLGILTEEEIKYCMDEAQGYWDELKNNIILLSNEKANDYEQSLL